MNQFNSFLESLVPGQPAWLSADRLGMDANMFHSFATDLLVNGRDGFHFESPKYEAMSSHRHITLLKGTRETIR